MPEITPEEVPSEPIVEEVAVAEAPAEEPVAEAPAEEPVAEADPVTGLSVSPAELEEVIVENKELVKKKGWTYIPIAEIYKVLFVEGNATYQLDAKMGRPAGEFILRRVKV